MEGLEPPNFRVIWLDSDLDILNPSLERSVEVWNSVSKWVDGF